MDDTPPKYIPGLEKVPAVESKVSFIDGQIGLLEYRGYNINELAQKSTFEEVSYLLLTGTLPTSEQLQEFNSVLSESRALSDDILQALQHFPASVHPMNALQAGVTLLESGDKDAHSVDDQAANYRRALGIIARLPTLVAAFHRLRGGQEVLPPNPKLPLAADFLHMLTGTAPDELSARVFDTCLILHADHTINNSTFTSRVVGSTKADAYAVIAAAVGSLSGPLHGGANERVLEMLDAVGSAEAAAAYVERKLGEPGGRVMGLGHRVYKTKDPRAIILQNMIPKLFARLGSTPMFETAQAVEKAATERVGHKGVYPNVDFYSGIVYARLGIPTDLFTPVFAIGRAPGWLAHWLEQMADNRIFRPTQVYVGERAQTYQPLEQRG